MKQIKSVEYVYNGKEAIVTYTDGTRRVVASAAELNEVQENINVQQQRQILIEKPHLAAGKPV
jgi:hypothetical protein